MFQVTLTISLMSDPIFLVNRRNPKERPNALKLLNHPWIAHARNGDRKLSRGSNKSGNSQKSVPSPLKEIRVISINKKRTRALSNQQPKLVQDAKELNLPQSKTSRHHPSNSVLESSKEPQKTFSSYQIKKISEKKGSTPKIPNGVSDFERENNPSPSHFQNESNLTSGQSFSKSAMKPPRYKKILTNSSAGEDSQHFFRTEDSKDENSLVNISKISGILEPEDLGMKGKGTKIRRTSILEAQIPPELSAMEPESNNSFQETKLRKHVSKASGSDQLDSSNQSETSERGKSCWDGSPTRIIRFKMKRIDETMKEDQVSSSNKKISMIRCKSGDYVDEGAHVFQVNNHDYLDLNVQEQQFESALGSGESDLQLIEFETPKKAQS